MPVNTAELQQYIEKAGFPASKMELLNTALNHYAPDEVIEFIKRFPDREYASPEDVEEVARAVPQ